MNSSAELLPSSESYRMSELARTHGDAMFNLVSSLDEPPSFITLESPHSILASNFFIPSRIPHGTFACAEFVSPTSILKFSHNGTDYRLRGNAFTQFTYSTRDSEASLFHSATKEVPEYSEIDRDALSSVVDAINHAARMPVDPVRVDDFEISNFEINEEINGYCDTLLAHHSAPTTDGSSDMEKESPAPLASVFLAAVAGPISPIPHQFTFTHTLSPLHNLLNVSECDDSQHTNIQKDCGQEDEDNEMEDLKIL
jgi:hypothetical protein